MSKVKAVPDGVTAVTPYLIVRGAAAAIEFYTLAFGARERYRMPMPDGSIAHAEIEIGTARLFLADENPGQGAQSPQALGGSPVSFMHYVEDADRAFAHAVAAGATGVAPPMDMFWGDRWSLVADPFGHQWQIATHKEDLTPEEMQTRMAAMSAAE
jgi:PhnB protein